MRYFFDERARLKRLLPPLVVGTLLLGTLDSLLGVSDWLLNYLGHFSGMPVPQACFLLLAAGASLPVLISVRGWVWGALTGGSALGAYAFAMMLTLVVTGRQLLSPTLNASLGIGMIVGTALVAGCVAGAITAVALRRLGVRLIPTAPNMCWRCGYSAGWSAETCPECGARMDPRKLANTLGHAIIRFCDRHRVGMRVVYGVTLAVVAGGILYWWELSPEAAICRRKFGREFEWPGLVFPEATSDPNAKGKDALAMLLPARPGGVSRFCVVVLPRDAPGYPAMQIWAQRLPLPQGSTEYGTDLVRCSLGKAMADSVLDEGVPDDLLEAIEKTQHKLDIGESRSLVVDPTPFFEGRLKPPK
ncbi:MAG: hypothetical protein GC200_08300 [Tepidisphaera sp.]|nr:hypothetical protein [Tepidisphaera sp.]